MAMMIEIPDALKPMLEPLRELVAEAEKQVDRCSALSREARYEAFEGELADKLAAVERGAHEAALSALDVNASQIRIRGELFVSVVRSQTTYRSQAGEVPVMRTLYRRAGDRNGPTVDPVALRAGMIDGVWLPGAARDMAYLLSQGTTREQSLRPRDGSSAVLAFELRAGGARRRRGVCRATQASTWMRSDAAAQRLRPMPSM